MSLIAFTSTKDKFILLSDGREVHVSDRDTPTRMNRRKCWKLSKNAGFLWLGYYPKNFDLASQLMGHTSAREASEDAATRLYRRIDPALNHLFTGPDRLRYCLYFLGFNPEPVLYMIDSERGPFKVYKVPYTTGHSAFHGYSPEVTNKTIDMINPLPPDEYKARNQFKGAVDSLAADGYPVGGNVFCETIHAKKQSKFREALANA